MQAQAIESSQYSNSSGVIDPLDFLYEHFGQYISPETEFRSSFVEGRCERCGTRHKVIGLPTRKVCVRCHALTRAYPMLSKQGEIRLGAKDSLIYVTPHKTRVICDNAFRHPKVEVIPLVAGVSLRRTAAEIILSRPPAPYLLAVLGKADSGDTMRVTVTPDVAYLCGQWPMRVSTRIAATAHQAVRGFPAPVWRKACELRARRLVAPAGSTPESTLSHRQGVDAALSALYAKHPGLSDAIPLAPVFESPEYELVSWAFIGEGKS